MAEKKKGKEAMGEEHPRGPVNLGDIVDYREGSIVSRTLVDDKSGRVVVFAFDEGTSLSEHTTPYGAIVQMLDGAADITVSGETHSIVAGELIFMSPGEPHSIVATQPFKMMVIMTKG